MTTRDQLKELALLRLQEAEALFEAGLFDGAKYVAGYVVECGLKARICRILDVQEYPSSGEFGRVYATHDLDRLLTLAGLRRKLTVDNEPVHGNWSFAVPWKPEQRYDQPGTVTREDAENVLNAIREKKHGVLPWIKKHW